MSKLDKLNRIRNKKEKIYNKELERLNDYLRFIEDKDIIEAQRQTVANALLEFQYAEIEFENLLLSERDRRDKEFEERMQAIYNQEEEWDEEDEELEL